MKLVSKSNLALISFVCGLQYSSNFGKWLPSMFFLVLSPMRCIDQCQSLQTMPLFSCTFLPLRALLTHILKYSCTLSSTWWICCRGYHQQSNSFRTFYVGYIPDCGSLGWSYIRFSFTIWFLLKTCLLFWNDSFSCVLFMLGIMICFRHLGTSGYVKQLQTGFILVSGYVFNWFSQLFVTCSTLNSLFSGLYYYVVVPYLFQAVDGLFTLWLPIHFSCF